MRAEYLNWLELTNVYTFSTNVYTFIHSFLSPHYINSRLAKTWIAMNKAIGYMEVRPIQ